MSEIEEPEETVEESTEGTVPDIAKSVVLEGGIIAAIVIGILLFVIILIFFTLKYYRINIFRKTG